MVFIRLARNRFGRILELAKAWQNGLKKTPRTLNWTAADSLAVPFDFGIHGNAELAKKITALFGTHRLLFSIDDIPELDEGNFISYLKRHKTVFVMWYDPLCPVCKKSMPHFERLYEDMKGSMQFGLINASANQDLAMSQDINAFPTFRLYRCNGKCTFKHHEGLLDYGEMKSFVSFISTEHESSQNHAISVLGQHSYLSKKVNVAPDKSAMSGLEQYSQILLRSSPFARQLLNWLSYRPYQACKNKNHSPLAELPIFLPFHCWNIKQTRELNSNSIDKGKPFEAPLHTSTPGWPLATAIKAFEKTLVLEDW